MLVLPYTETNQVLYKYCILLIDKNTTVYLLKAAITIQFKPKTETVNPNLLSYFSDKIFSMFAQMTQMTEKL